jgi:hypothetical protein
MKFLLNIVVKYELLIILVKIQTNHNLFSLKTSFIPLLIYEYKKRAIMQEFERR